MDACEDTLRPSGSRSPFPSDAGSVVAKPKSSRPWRRQRVSPQLVHSSHLTEWRRAGRFPSKLRSEPITAAIAKVASAHRAYVLDVPREKFRRQACWDSAIWYNSRSHLQASAWRATAMQRRRSPGIDAPLRAPERSRMSIMQARVPDVLAQRGRTLQAAWALHPERFVHGTPKPAPLPEAVWINPPATSTTGEPPPSPSAGRSSPGTTPSTAMPSH